jgi:hypothetical protein
VVPYIILILTYVLPSNTTIHATCIGPTNHPQTLKSVKIITLTTFRQTGTHTIKKPHKKIIKDVYILIVT